MFCDLSYRQDEGTLEGLEKDRATIFQRIRQRQECEKKQAICLYTVGRKRRRRTRLMAIVHCIFKRTCTGNWLTRFQIKRKLEQLHGFNINYSSLVFLEPRWESKYAILFELRKSTSDYVQEGVITTKL